MQAAVQADRPAHFLSTFVNVKDHELQSLPPSQDYLTPPDTALLRSSFPQLLHHFSEADAVKLMLLGLRDCDAVGCIVHGVQRNSKVSASQLNPVDAVFRKKTTWWGGRQKTATLICLSPVDGVPPI